MAMADTTCMYDVNRRDIGEISCLSHAYFRISGYFFATLNKLNNCDIYYIWDNNQDKIKSRVNDKTMF